MYERVLDLQKIETGIREDYALLKRENSAESFLDFIIIGNGEIKYTSGFHEEFEEQSQEEAVLKYAELLARRVRNLKRTNSYKKCGECPAYRNVFRDEGRCGVYMMFDATRRSAIRANTNKNNRCRWKFKKRTDLASLTKEQIATRLNRISSVNIRPEDLRHPLILRDRTNLT